MAEDYDYKEQAYKAYENPFTHESANWLATMAVVEAIENLTLEIRDLKEYADYAIRHTAGVKEDAS